MTQPHKFRKSMGRATGPALALMVVLAMVGYAIFGPTGLYAWGEYGQSVEKKRIQLSELQKRETELQNRVNLLDQRRVDPDLAEEYVRERLGAYHPDEVIIPMDVIAKESATTP
jgi:cell division protein FtsB